MFQRTGNRSNKTKNCAVNLTIRHFKLTTRDKRAPISLYAFQNSINRHPQNDPMTGASYEYKISFDDLWICNYTSFGEKHLWYKQTSRSNSVTLPHALAEGQLKHWALEEGLTAIYHCYMQRADIRYNMVTAGEPSWYCIYFDLSDTPLPCSAGEGLYQVYYHMSDAAGTFTVPHNNKAHSLQLMIRPGVFEQYFSISQDNVHHQALLKKLLLPDGFRGQMPMPLPLICTLMQLPRMAGDNVMELYQVKGCIYEILSRFLHALISPPTGSHGKSLSGLCQLIEVNGEIAAASDQELPSLEEAARMACMCLTKFKKLFRLTYQTTYHKYHQRLRLMKAKELFQVADMNITTIVHDLGYKNAGHFARLFKECFKISPKEYQRQFEGQP